jgi:Leucine-rich repeat (LRR) protein
MINISQESKDKLKQFIYSDTLETVIQGLDLIDTLVENKEDICFIFDLTDEKPIVARDFMERLPSSEFKEYILLLMLCKIGSLQPELVMNITEIKIFRVPKNIHKLPSSIEYLTELKEIWLTGDRLIGLPETIANLTNLETLDLTETDLRQTTVSELEEFFVVCSKIPKLQSIDLSWTDLTTIPTTLFQLSNLRCLSLNIVDRGCGLLRVPEQLRELKSLEDLCLAGNYCLENESLDIIGNLTTLKYLDLNNTNISFLPESIGNLTNLSILDLGANELTILPESIGNLTNLSILELGDSKLTTLPKSIESLTNLTKLDLSYNHLMKIPDSIENLTNLTSLHLRENQLITLPNSIRKLTQLDELVLVENPISDNSKVMLRTIFGDKVKF